MAEAGVIGGRRIVRIDKVSGIGFVEALSGIWRSGAIAMPVEPEAAPPNLGIEIADHVRVAPGGGWLRPAMPPCDPDSPALISFTSGTTGEPKAILLTHGALDDVTRRLVEVMRLDSSIREYVAVPVTFSFGAGRIRAIAEVGGEAFLPEQGFRPDQFAAMLGKGEVNALSAVPSMLRLILAQPQLFRESGSRLKWMEIGSQYMAGTEKKALRELFPNARIVQHYGLTEASRSTFLAVSDADESELESVGRATGDVEVRLDDEGIICIRGPHAAAGRLTDGKTEPLAMEDGWLRTADLGRLEDGLLFYLGRVDDVANISGVKVSADYFERALQERLGHAGYGLGVAVGEDPLRGQRLIVGLTSSVDRKGTEAAARQLAAESGLGAADLTFVHVADIPRTETGKVRRSALAKMVDEPLGAAGTEAAGNSGLSAAEAKLAAVWSDILGISEIGPEDSFFDLGGDSLSAVTVALRAEQEGLSADILQHMFEGRTLREITAITEGSATSVSPATRRSEMSVAINATRGILVLLVIGAHWLPFFLERMGQAGATLQHWLAPVFHLGTPGFAIVFGIGLVFFYRPLLQRSPESFRKKLRSNTTLLGAGVLLQAGMIALQFLVEQGALGPRWPEQMFYTVILFYLLMVPTAGLWLRFIYRSEAPALNALLVAVCSALLFLVVQLAWPLGPGPGGVRLVQHMLVAPYSYPLLLSAVCVGAAIGVWADRNADLPRFSAMAGWLGVVLLVGGVAAVTFFTAGWWSVAQTPAAFPAYAGAVTLLLAGMTGIVERNLLRMPSRLLAVVGLLAFPAFVAHGIVIPLIRVLVGLSVPYPVALAASVGLFLTLAFIAIRKLYRMLFGGTVRGNTTALLDGASDALLQSTQHGR